MSNKYDMIGSGSITVFPLDGQVMIAIPSAGLGVSLDTTEASGLAHAILAMIEHMPNKETVQ